MGHIDEVNREVEEREKRFRDSHQKEREVLFANESFLIGMLQVVAGGSLFAGLAQTSAIITLAGQRAFLGFLTLMGVALFSAVLAAYFKHQYKMWDVKGAATARKDQKEALRRSGLASRYLIAMRWSMHASVISFGVGILGLLAFSWVHAWQEVGFMGITPHVSTPLHPRVSY